MSGRKILSWPPGFLIVRRPFLQVGEPEVELAYSPAIRKAGIREERQHRSSDIREREVYPRPDLKASQEIKQSWPKLATSKANLHGWEHLLGGFPP